MLSPQESLKEKKLLDSFSESINYFPKEYAEVETDTLLSNGFRIYIKIYTDMGSSVLDEYKQDKIIRKDYYRDNQVLLQVSKDEELIFEQQFDKNYFTKNFPEEADFLQKSNLQGMWLDDSRMFKDKVTLSIYFCYPESDICIDFDLVINQDGTHNLTEVYLDDEEFD